MNESSTPSRPIKLFEYLRTLVDTATSSESSPKFALVEAYWHIGRIIVETEQSGQERADYGIHLIESLSEQLTQNFGKGYSLPNMWRFKQFFLAFPILSHNGRELPNLRTHLRTELVWSHYRILMQLTNLQERAFYLHMAADERWSYKVMQRMIRTRSYYQVALGEEQLIPQQKQATSKPASLQIVPALSTLGDTPRSQLATAKKILLERYVGYAFVAQRQFVTVDGQGRWVKLVFFHYVLNRFVLVHLGEHNPANRAAFTQLIDAYINKQPPSISTLPIGLLINQKALVKCLTSSHEQCLSDEQLSVIPFSFA